MNADDPYSTEIKWRPDGSVSIVVSAAVLPLPGDTDAVEAECTRRAELIRDNLVASLRPPPR